MDIEQAALPGIVRASNDAESDDFRSLAVAGMPGVGAVGVASCPQAIPTAATRMTKYPRTSRPSLERVARAESDDGAADGGAGLPEERAGGFNDVNHGLGVGEIENVQHQVKPLRILDDEFLLRAQINQVDRGQVVRP